MLASILFLCSIVAVTYVGGQGYRLWRSRQETRRLKKAAQALENYPDNPDRRILIVGDSIWAGVGAVDPAESMAGRLIADLPNALVVNKAESGAQITDGRRQLQEAQAEFEKSFDQIIIQLGANDILYLSGITASENELRNLLRESQVAAEDIAFTVSGSIGFAPVFWQLLDWFYTYQTRQYLDVFSAVAHDLGVEYIDLYRKRAADPFSVNPSKYYAADMFHPSGDGYGVWYSKCKDQLQCFRYDE
jgi:lysophospholipase L1-like esterase